MLRFLRYYLGLWRDVLLGRRRTSRPLGVRYRWRQWRYESHLRRLERKDWQR